MSEQRYPVLANFSQKDRKTGAFKPYSPGDVFVSGDVQLVAKLQAGVDHNGPLIGKALVEKKAPSTSDKETTQS
jgi:hypothetical protein